MQPSHISGGLKALQIHLPGRSCTEATAAIKTSAG